MSARQRYPSRGHAGLLVATLCFVSACGYEGLDAGPGLTDAPTGDAGGGPADAGEAADGGGAGCTPSEVQDFRFATGGEGCEAGEREEELTCTADGHGFEWQGVTAFDGSLRECEPGTSESRGEGCDEEQRSCASSGCTWGAFAAVQMCATDQVVFINFDGVTTDNTNDTIARFVAHELGHSFGLHHVDNATGIMNWDSSGSTFSAAALAEEQACGLTLGQTQDAPAILAANLGLRDDVNVGASCYVAGAMGGCIDTAADTCAGDTHVGACPGPAEIRCCTP